MRNVLVPGRHHLLTRFQGSYLSNLMAGEELDTEGRPVSFDEGARLVWAVTSANHSGTRRNPLGFDRREAMIERFSVLEDLECLVVPVFDVAPTPAFATVTLNSVENVLGIVLTPEDTVVACSTPAVMDMYKDLGFRVVSVELHPDGTARERPWDVVEDLLADRSWRDAAHPATLSVFDRYDLVSYLKSVCLDPTLGSEGSLTETRDYSSYIAAFEDAADRKWAQAAPYVVPGRIVDVGCASGGMIERIAAEPSLHESDIYGVEIARRLFDECEYKRAQGVFKNPNTFFLQRNLLAGPVFPSRSVDTTLSFALTHEIYSYGEQMSSLRTFVENIYAQTRPGGVWINSDVCGPEDPDGLVTLELEDRGEPVVDMSDWALDAVTKHVESLSRGGRLRQFARDFARLGDQGFWVEEITPGRFKMRRRDAMEFLETRDYSTSWLSECHERFCFLDWDGWRSLVEEVGFEVDERSGPWVNEWLVENRFEADGTRLRDLNGKDLPWPSTHLLLVARRPLNS